LSTKIICKEFCHACPGIPGGFGFIHTGVTISEEGVTGTGVDNNIVLEADCIEEVVELLDGTNRYG
jgi:hypothetical protein